MSIDEAIAHAREVAERHRKSAKYAGDRFLTKRMQDMHRKNSIKEAEKHEQIAQWLEELKELREKAECDRCVYNCACTDEIAYKTGYNKAVDDFSNKLKTYNNCENRVNMDVCAYSDDCRFCTYVVGKGHVCMLDDISEQLKEGGVDAGSI